MLCVLCAVLCAGVAHCLLPCPTGAGGGRVCICVANGSGKSYEIWKFKNFLQFAHPAAQVERSQLHTKHHTSVGLACALKLGLLAFVGVLVVLSTQVRDAGNLLTRAGLALPTVDLDTFVMHYSSAVSVLCIYE